MMKEEKTCTSCGAEYPAEQLIQFGDAMLCRTCLNTETVVCSHCGVRVWNDNDYGDSSIPLCERCYNEYYTTCSRCERVIHRDYAYYEGEDDDPYCSDCYNRCSSSRAIHDYYYKPVPKFYGENGRYFGVELEVDDAGEDDECAETVLNIANGSNEHIYCKHDGSLDNGFEIVTHPMTLDYQLNKMPWLDVVTKLREMGYLSHQANTCGLHVHVNRSSLGNIFSEQEATIAGHFTGKQKNKIISILSVACEERGTDATGISYNYDEHLSVFKRPLAAYKMRFAIPNVPLIMGHTRMTTQGDEKRNYNNHPFYGKVDNIEFTLAHNGVLHNDEALHKSEKLPETKIETDSYVAVQLIEKKKELSFESLKFMAEKLLGSFTITVMDKEDNL